MDALLITPQNEADFKLISDLLARLNITPTILAEEDLEDMGLVELMKEADLSEKVSRAEIMAKLTS